MTSTPSDQEKAKGTSQKTKVNPGYRVWHLALVVPAIAVTLQLLLGSLTPLPQEHNPHTTHYAAASTSQAPRQVGREYRPSPSPQNTQRSATPLNLRGEMTGSLLASVIEDYFPQSTEQHADDLRDTMPPCIDPRMIVILPQQEIEAEPMF